METQPLFENICPRCEEELVLFEHINTWKCHCGFTITEEKKKEFQEKFMNHHTENFTTGFSMKDFQDDPPF